jgi:hypothetical protein
MTSADLKEGLRLYSNASGRVGVIIKRTDRHATIHWEPRQGYGKSILDLVRFLDDPYPVNFLIDMFEKGILRELTVLESELWY